MKYIQKNRFALVVLLLLLGSLGMNAQDRGLAVSAAAGDLDSAAGKQWAVFIAIDRYQEWMPLANPVKDAHEIRDILTEYYYIDEIVELYNLDATAAGIRQLLINLRTRVGKDDSVFVFYAGHGQTDPYTNTGFWIPADGGRDMMSQTNWLPNIQVRNMVSQLPARHVFLVSDSCFSGDILDISRGSGPVLDSDYFRRAYSRVSRQVMTSGASETVPDTSEFALRLKSTLLRAEGSFIDPYYLFTSVREVRNTQPMLGTIRCSEHQEGGSFLFFRKSPAGAGQERRIQRPEAAPYTPGFGGNYQDERTSTQNNSAWKDKWIYLGVGFGIGSSTSVKTTQFSIPDFPYYYNHEKEEKAPLYAPGMIIDFFLLPFFSIELGFNFGLGYGDRDVVPVIPILAKLGYRILQMEFSIDAGYTIGAGFTIGGTFGVNVGMGILFAKFLSIPKASHVEGNDNNLVSGMAGFLGYKIGIINKR